MGFDPAVMAGNQGAGSFIRQEVEHGIHDCFPFRGVGGSSQFINQDQGVFTCFHVLHDSIYP